MESIFGYPCLEPKSWDQFQSTIGKIYTQKSEQVDVKIGDLTISEDRVKVVPRGTAVIDGVVLDTFSELSKSL